MTDFKIFRTFLFAVLVVLGVSSAYLIHRSFVNQAVETAVEKAALDVKIGALRSEILEVMVEERWADMESDRSDVDRIIRSIARMRNLRRLQVQANGVSDNLYTEAKLIIVEEATYISPYVYKYGDREVFLAFGDAIYYAGLAPERIGLGPDYWTELAKSKYKAK